MLVVHSLAFLPSTYYVAPLLLDACQVLVLMLQDSQWEEAAAAVRAEEESAGLDNAYIVSFIAPSMGEGGEINGGELPTKALLNAVSDLCQTR